MSHNPTILTIGFRLCRGNRALALGAVLWIGCVAIGLAKLWDYENSPAPAGHAVRRWPAAASVARDPSRPTLITFAHPHCPCSRASVRELARLMARVGTRAAAYVLFVRPDSVPAGWERTALWDEAAKIPGVRVTTVDAAQARAFGARVSGETLLFSADGDLLFAGGITASRGHEGDNVGRSQVTALLTGAAAAAAPPRRTSVFGCFLTGDPSPSPAAE